MIVAFWPRRLLALSVAAVAVAGAVAFARMRAAQLEDNAFWSGWTLLAIFVVLAVYNLRKRVSNLPLGTSATWLQWHIYLGLIAIALIHVHIGWHMPSGSFSWLLYGLFWAVSLTGVLGLILTRTLPHLLTAVGNEVIFERIGERVVDLHDEAAGIVQGVLGRPEGQVLAGFFIDRLDPFLRRPRWAWQESRERWLTSQCANVARLAGPDLADAVADLEEIAHEKLLLDRHYFLQGILKGWLFVHIPLATMALTAAVYHTGMVLWFRP